MPLYLCRWPNGDCSVVWARTKEDAIVPGATFLGAARADHLAIALPFEDLADGEIRSFMDHNHYPRSALLEALVRFAIEDVEKPQ